MTVLFSAPEIDPLIPSPDQPSRQNYYNQVEARFRDPFSEQNGEIEAYSVILSKEIRLPPDMQEHTWAEAQRDSGITAYVAIHRCADFFENKERCDFNSGATSSVGKRRRQAGSGDVITVVIGELVPSILQHVSTG